MKNQYNFETARIREKLQLAKNLEKTVDPEQNTDTAQAVR